MFSKLAFPSNAILSCLFLFFLIINLYFLITAVIAQIFIPTAKLAIPTATPTNDTNAEIETQPLTAKINSKKIFKVVQSLTNLFMLFTH